MGKEEIPPGDGEGSTKRSVHMGEAPETRGDPENSGRAFFVIRHQLHEWLAVPCYQCALSTKAGTHTGDGRDCEEDAPQLE